MKVKVTSSGITQKGTSTHLVGTRFSTLTAIPSPAPTITVPRVPNKPAPRPYGMNVVVAVSDQIKRRDSAGETTDFTKGRPSVSLLRDAQPRGQNTSSLPTKSVTSSTLHYTSNNTTSSSSSKSTPTSKPKVQKATNASKPTTQAVRIAVQSKNKVSATTKRETPVIVQDNRRQQVATKKDANCTTTTKEVKQVFVKHVSSSSTSKPRINVAVKKQTQPRSPPTATPKKSVTFQDTTKPVIKSASKPATKRKSETPLPKIVSKVAKPCLGKEAHLNDISEPTPEPEGEITESESKSIASGTASTVSSEIVASANKKKRKYRSWKATSSPKQGISLALIYGTMSNGVIEDGLGHKQKNEVSFLSNADIAYMKEMAHTPVAGEIKDLLHAFGDSSEPLSATVQLMEEIVLHEVTGFIRVCEQKAALRGGKTLGVMDALVALRRNIPRIERMYKHFGFKDIYERKVLRMSRPKDRPKGREPLVTQKMQEMIRELNLVECFHLLNVGLDEIESSLQGIEDSKLEEAVRSYPEMLKFYQYAKTRSLSFARKLSTVNIRKLVITNCHIFAKMTDTFGTVLDFFILDFVAEVVDSAFGIRKERLVHCADTRVANPDTCMSAPFFLKKRKDDRCNQVSEILVQASEMEATRLKKDQKKSGERRWPETTISKPAPILYPGYIREVYMRIQSDFRRPTLSYANQASMYLNSSHQYF